MRARQIFGWGLLFLPLAAFFVLSVYLWLAEGQWEAIVAWPTAGAVIGLMLLGGRLLK